jgi:hypothetical protein
MTISPSGYHHRFYTAVRDPGLLRRGHPVLVNDLAHVLHVHLLDEEFFFLELFQSVTYRPWGEVRFFHDILMSHCSFRAEDLEHDF